MLYKTVCNFKRENTIVTKLFIWVNDCEIMIVKHECKSKSSHYIGVQAQRQCHKIRKRDSVYCVPFQSYYDFWSNFLQMCRLFVNFKSI